MEVEPADVISQLNPILINQSKGQLATEQWTIHAKKSPL